MNKCYVISPKENERLGRVMFTDLYPENTLSLKEQREYYPNNYFDVITQSPLIIGQFWTKDVLVWSGKEFIKPKIETYGASFDFILTSILDFDTLISDRAMQHMKEAIKSKDIVKLKYIRDSFGESFEKRFIFQEIARLEKEDV